MDGQCDKLVTVLGHQFITLTSTSVYNTVLLEAPCRAELSAVAETCCYYIDQFVIRAKARGYVFLPALVCLSVCVSVCGHDN